MDEYYTVLLETSGNQAFVFETNKLRETVGASELIYQVGTAWVVKAVCRARGVPCPDKLAEPGVLCRFLRDQQQNPPIEHQPDPQKAVEIVVAASGKAIVLTRSRQVAEHIITQVTWDALRQAPGLTVRGAISAGFAWGEPGAVDAAIKGAHGRHAALAGRVPGPDSRFLRLPVVRPCQTSGAPAAVLYCPSKTEAMPLSVVAQRKGGYGGGRGQNAPAHAYLKRMRALVGDDLKGLLFDTIEQMEKAFGQHMANAADGAGQEATDNKPLDWLAVIHADGNGLGAIFTNFYGALKKTQAEPPCNREYVRALRDFSLALDICTCQAFCAALQHIKPAGAHETVGVVPLVLGGDDLTVIATGGVALPFTIAYLQAFERISAELVAADDWGVDPANADIIQRLSPPYLSAAAGAALVKPHYPFHAAYDLAEELTASAKQAKHWAKAEKSVPLSSLDFHLLYDSTAGSLATIRQTLLTVPAAQGGVAARLFARPYLLTEGADATGPNATVNRRWSQLEALLKAMALATEDGRAAGRLLHQLRTALYRGEAVAEAQYALVRARLGQTKAGRQILAKIGGDDGLFFDLEAGVRACRVLDALEIREFWPIADAAQQGAGDTHD